MKKNIKLCILLEVNELSENKDDMIQEESLTIIKEAYKPTLFVPTLAIVVAIGPYGSMLLTIADGNEANLMGGRAPYSASTIICWMAVVSLCS